MVNHRDYFLVKQIGVSKGLGVVAARPIAAGEVIYSFSARQVISEVFPSLRTFEDRLSSLGRVHAADLCAHSIPGVNGAVYTISSTCPISFENHSELPSSTPVRWDLLMQRGGYFRPPTSLTQGSPHTCTHTQLDMHTTQPSCPVFASVLFVCCVLHFLSPPGFGFEVQFLLPLSSTPHNNAETQQRKTR